MSGERLEVSEKGEVTAVGDPLQSSAPKPTQGPWRKIEASVVGNHPSSIRIEAEGDVVVAQIGRIAGRARTEEDYVRLRREMEANARLIAAAPELISELKLAHKIIINALNVMTTDQKLAWDKLNTRDDLKDGLALTRNKARETVIAKAEGREVPEPELK